MTESEKQGEHMTTRERERKEEKSGEKMNKKWEEHVWRYNKDCGVKVVKGTIIHA